MFLDRQIIGSETEEKTQEKELLSREEWEKLHLGLDSQNNAGNSDNDLQNESMGVGIAALIDTFETIISNTKDCIDKTKILILNCIKGIKK